MHLSQHFTLEELTRSQIAARYGIDNNPPIELIERGELLCTTLLEPIRAHFGPVFISSAYRCLEVNRRLGSKDSSQHPKFEAADVEVQQRPLAVCHWIADSNLPFHQLIYEYGRWSHVSIAPLGAVARREVLTIDNYGARLGLLDIRA